MIKVSQNHNGMGSDQKFEPGTPIKQYAVLTDGRKVFIDRQNGDGQKAWFYAGRQRIDPADIKEWK